MNNSNQGNIFVSFYKSITDVGYYKHFVHETTGKAFSYLIVISLFFFLISMVPNIARYKDTVRQLFNNLERLPYFEVKNGRFTMESDKYHVAYEDKETGLIIVLDPVNEYRSSDLDYYQMGILVTETRLIQKIGASVNTMDLSNLSMLALTKDKIIQNFSKFFLSLIPALIIYLIIFGIGIKILACYIVHILTIIYVMIKRIDMDKKSVFRVSCHAITLPVVLGTVISLFKLSVVLWDWIFVLTAFLYSYNAVKKYAKDRNLYIKAEEPFL